jgi:hypothetical protein
MTLSSDRSASVCLQHVYDASHASARPTYGPSNFFFWYATLNISSAKSSSSCTHRFKRERCAADDVAHLRDVQPGEDRGERGDEHMHFIVEAVECNANSRDRIRSSVCDRRIKPYNAQQNVSGSNRLPRELEGAFTCFTGEVGLRDQPLA